MDEMIDTIKGMFRTVYDKLFKRRVNVLIIGGDGMLGHDVKELLESESRKRDGWIGVVAAPSSKEVDAADKWELGAFLDSARKFDVVVNCAGFTDTTACEGWGGRKASYKANVKLPRNIATECRNRGMKMVHISTNEVFHDCKSMNWLPADRPEPFSVYGMEKYIGELVVSNILPERRYSIFRVSWLFGAHGNKSFVHKCTKSFVEYLKSGRKTELYGVVDECATPTSTRLVANVVMDAIVNGGLQGVHHVSDCINASRWWFMAEILEAFHVCGYFKDLDAKEIKEVSYLDVDGLRPMGTITLDVPWKDDERIRFANDRYKWTSELSNLIRHHGKEIIEWAEKGCETQQENAECEKRTSTEKE